MFAIILVIHPSLSLNISQKLSNLHLYSDILRGGFCFQLDRLHRKSVHYILTSRFFVFEGQLWVAFPYGFFIHESLAFWTNLNSIMFRVFIVRFNQSFWLKLYFFETFFFLRQQTHVFGVLMSCFPVGHLWVLELWLAVLPERKDMYSTANILSITFSHSFFNSHLLCSLLFVQVFFWL